MAISSIFDETPRALIREVGVRARARRLATGWSQDELAARAGVSLDAVKRLEASGRVSLETLARIAIALDASPSLQALFPMPAARSIDELEAQAASRTRVYARRRDAGIPRGPKRSSSLASEESESK